MKTLSKTITGYSFDELNTFAQDKAKNCILERERLPGFFSNDLTDELKEDFGLYHLKTFFSLSCCQGDGLCLYGTITFSELFENPKFKKIALKGIHHKHIQSVYDEMPDIDFIHKGRYCHKNSIDMESRFYSPTEKQEAIMEKIIDNVKSWYGTFCRKWEENGYDYFYEISDEEMKIICHEDDCLFTETGNLINRIEYLELTA